MGAIPALILAAVVLFATGAAATRARQPPPIAFASSRTDRDLVILGIHGDKRRVVTPSPRDDAVPSWSPDGIHVAFSHYDGWRERVDILNLRTGQIVDVGAGYNPDWSPDGNELVFVDAERFDDLVTMSADGSGRRNLGLTTYGIGDETDAAWSPDGRLIAFSANGLHTVRPDGTDVRTLQSSDALGRVTWSPGADRIAFDCGFFQVCVVNADGSGRRTIAFRGGSPSWSPRGDLIAVTNGQPWPITILVRPNGSRVRVLRSSGGDPDWSPDGQQLIVTADTGGDRLFSTDSAGRELARLTRGPIDAAPAWSPNGQSIAFRRIHSGRCELAVRLLTSARIRTLVPRSHDRFCRDRPDWSADGKRIVYESSGDLWLLSTAGRKARRLTRTSGREASPRFAPDRRSIGFVGRAGIWLLHPRGGRTLLVRDGGSFAWSHDGRSLAYLRFNRATGLTDLYVRSRSMPPRRLAEGIDDGPTWSPDDRFIAFTHSDPPNSGGSSSLVVSDLSGHATEIFDDASQPDWRP